MLPLAGSGPLGLALAASGWLCLVTGWPWLCLAGSGTWFTKRVVWIKLSYGNVVLGPGKGGDPLGALL